MAFGVKYTCNHKTKVNGNTTTFTIDIMENGYTGGVTNIKGMDDVFTLNYEKSDSSDVLIQKARLELFIAIKGTGIDGDLGYDGVAILNEIFNADEGQYRLRLSINGNEFWKGAVLNDLLEYPDGKYVYSGKIVAKDLTTLSGFTFPLTDDRVTVIETIADLLDDLNLGLPIKTYTSWINQDTNDNDDYLNQIYNDRYSLRQFGNEGRELDQELNHEELLKKLLTNHGLILRQVGNAWRLYQLSALENPTSVMEFTYDATGTQTSSAVVDLTQDIDRVARYILPDGINQGNSAIKKTRVNFNHRDKISTLKVPTDIYLRDDSFISTETPFISNGQQEIRLSGTVRLYSDQNVSDGYVDIMIRTGQYYWNGSAWTLNSTDRVRVDVTGLGFELESDGSSELYVYNGYFSISTSPVKADATTPLEIKFPKGVIGTSPVIVATKADYTNLSFEMVNPINSEDNTTSISYELTQSGDYSKVKDLEDIWFADFSTSSFASLRYSPNSDDITSATWQRRGSTNYRLFTENLLSEHLDIRRSTTRNFEGELIGDYSPENVVGYGASYLFFLGGTLTGKTNQWKGSFLDIDVRTGNDTFNQILNFSGEGSSTSSGGRSGGVGFSLSTADARYLKQTNNGSDFDDPLAFKQNLGLEIGSDVQAYSPDLSKLANNDGSKLTDLNATEIKTGTLSTGRLSGSYTGLTGTGALNAGSITSGFGNIDIGSSTLNVGGQSTLDGNVVMNSGYLWNKNGMSYLSGGAIVGSSAVPTYDFEVEGNSHFKTGWLWIEDSYLQVGDRVGINTAPYGSGRLSDSSLQVSGSFALTNDMFWVEGVSVNDYSWSMGPRGTNLLNVQNFGSPYAVMSVAGSSVADPTTESCEGTLALYRGNASGSDSEFLDLYNNGYSTSREYGISIQKRGIGQWRRFLFGYDDGTAYTNMFTVNPPDGGNNIVTDVAVEVGGTITSTGDSIAPDHRSPSDIRLKKLLKKGSGREIARFANLWLYEKEGMERLQWGLIAQDMLQADKDLVHEMDHERLGKTLTLSSYSIASVALHGVKELDEDVESLKNEIKTLRAELARRN